MYVTCQLGMPLDVACGKGAGRDDRPSARGQCRDGLAHERPADTPPLVPRRDLGVREDRARAGGPVLEPAEELVAVVELEAAAVDGIGERSGDAAILPGEVGARDEDR